MWLKTITITIFQCALKTNPLLLCAIMQMPHQHRCETFSSNRIAVIYSIRYACQLKKVWLPFYCRMHTHFPVFPLSITFYNISFWFQRKYSTSFHRHVILLKHFYAWLIYHKSDIIVAKKVQLWPFIKTAKQVNRNKCDSAY